MASQIGGITLSYRISTLTKDIWEIDFEVAKEIFDALVKHNETVKLFVEEWEGEPGGEGEHSDICLIWYDKNNGFQASA